MVRVGVSVSWYDRLGLIVNYLNCAKLYRCDAVDNMTEAESSAYREYCWRNFGMSSYSNGICKISKEQPYQILNILPGDINIDLASLQGV